MAGAPTDDRRGVVAVVAVSFAPLLLLIVLGKAAVFADVDERELMFASVDRLLGAPSVALAWPSAPLQLVLAPILALRAAASGVRAPGSASSVLSTMYLDPTSGLLLARLTVGALVAGGAWAALRRLRDLAVPTWLSVLIVSALLAAPATWANIGQVRGDAPAGVLTFAALLWLLPPRARSLTYREVLVAGLLLGAAAALRSTYLLYVPLGAVLAWFNFRSDDPDQQRRLRGIARFVIAAAASFAVLCPYVWTDPVRMAKSIAGNAARAGSSALSLELLWQVGPALLALAVIAVVAVARQADRVVVIAGGFALLLFAFVVTRGVVYDRYLILVLPAIALLIAAASRGADWFGGTAGRWGRSIAIATGALLVLQAGAATWSLRTDLVGTDALLADVRDAVGQAKGHVLFVDANYLYEALPSMSRGSIERQIDSSSRAFANLLSAAPTEPAASEVRAAGAPLAVLEDDQAQIARLHAVAPVASAGGDIRVFGLHDGLAARFGYLTVDQLRCAAPGDIVLSANRVTPPGLTIEWTSSSQANVGRVVSSEATAPCG